MHEKILQGVTVGVVAGLFVYWLTSDHHADYAGKNSNPGAYKPVYGDISALRTGRGTCACCQCCGLVTPQTTSNPLATDYLDCSPQYSAPTSRWNVGISLQLSCEGIDLHSCVNRRETATSFPHGLCGPQTVARPFRNPQQIECSPSVCLPVDCTGVI